MKIFDLRKNTSRYISGHDNNSVPRFPIGPKQIFSWILLMAMVAATYYLKFILGSTPLSAVFMSVTLIVFAVVFLTYGMGHASGNYYPAFVRQLKLIVLSLFAAFASLDVILAVTEQTALSSYFISNALAFLVVALAFTGLKPAAKIRLNAASTVVFAVFAALVAFKIANMLATG